MTTLGRLQFDDVDATGDAERHAACLAVLANALAGMRAQTLARLGIRPGLKFLDAGCGAGELAVEIAPLVKPGGRVVGIDKSRDLVARASARAAQTGVEAEFLEADITHLPFADGEFDVVRSERVFQHLDRADTPHAANELIRVVRSGGLVQVVDPDHLQTALDATDRELVRLLLERLARYSRNPESGLHLAGLLRSAAAPDVDLEIWPLTITHLADFRAARDLDRELAGLVADGEVDTARAAAFVSDLEDRDRAGAFLATIISYAVTATRA